MQVKIVKCLNSKYWYNNLVGQVIDVEGDAIGNKNYWVVKRSNNEVGLLIDKEDTVLFNREIKIYKILNKLKKFGVYN